MEIQLQKVPCKMKLHGEPKFLNNSVIYKNVELKFSTDTYFWPLILESNINPIPHGIFCITHTWGGQIPPVPYRFVISKDMDL